VTAVGEVPVVVALVFAAAAVAAVAVIAAVAAAVAAAGVLLLLLLLLLEKVAWLGVITVNQVAVHILESYIFSPLQPFPGAEQGRKNAHPINQQVK